MFTNLLIYAIIWALHKSNTFSPEWAFLSLVKMHTPLFCVLWLVVKICVATIGVAFFGASASVGALFYFGG